MPRTRWYPILAALLTSCRACSPESDPPSESTIEKQTPEPGPSVAAPSSVAAVQPDSTVAPKEAAVPVFKRSTHGATGFQVHEVVIKDNQYSPSTLRIKAGDTVRWVTKDLDRKHYVIEGEPGNGTHLFVSPWLNQSTKSFSYTFDRAGTFIYHCREHPQTMRGAKVIVE